jgi:hypothetical protein
LIDDSELRRRFAAAGHDCATRLHDLKHWRQAHLDLYRRLLSERRGGGAT